MRVAVVVGRRRHSNSERRLTNTTEDLDAAYASPLPTSILERRKWRDRRLTARRQVYKTSDARRRSNRRIRLCQRIADHVRELEAMGCEVLTIVDVPSTRRNVYTTQTRGLREFVQSDVVRQEYWRLLGYRLPGNPAAIVAAAVADAGTIHLEAAPPVHTGLIRLDE